MNILCGTDFSPNAADAVQTAAGLARRFNDTLELIHATLPPADEGLPPEVWLPVEGVLRQQIESLRDSLTTAGTRVKAEVELGTPAEVLRRRAKPGSTRMLVVASLGRVGLARVLLGSTADRVAESAAVPTLVVRNSLPFRDWFEGRRPLRVLVAVDFSDSSEAALGFAREFTQAGACELIAGYVAHADEATEGTSPSQREAELREKVAAQLQPHRFELAVAPAGQTASEGLIELAKEYRADVIVTGAHQHRGLARIWHQSTSRSLLADAPTSVLVVPSQARSLARSVIPPLSRVLVTTDLSPLGNQAIPAACALLSRGGVLRILHVAAPVEGAFSFLRGRSRRPVLSPGEHHQLVQHARRKLGSLIPAEALQRHITHEVVVVVSGDVAETIDQQARQFGAHVICLASHGQGAALSVLFGSVAQQVIAQSTRPVHVVRCRR